MREGDSCATCSLLGFYSAMWPLGYTTRKHLSVYACPRCDGIDPASR